MPRDFSHFRTDPQSIITTQITPGIDGRGKQSKSEGNYIGLLHSPRDKFVWDVGHQAYVHKLLTGRRDRFGTIRQLGGLSGYTTRDESAHDV